MSRYDAESSPLSRAIYMNMNIIQIDYQQFQHVRMCYMQH